MNQEEMKKRTKEFAKRMIRLCRSLPSTRESMLIADQLFRAGTSVGANYRAACRARSKAEFVSKLGVALEEADESMYWLEIISESKILKEKLLQPLIEEANQIVSILVTSINTAKGR